MPEVPAKEPAQQFDVPRKVIPQRLRRFALQGGAGPRDRVEIGDAIPQFQTKIDANRIPDLTASKHDPGKKRPSQLPGRVVDRELAAAIVINAKESQRPQVFAPRVACNVIEQGRQDALSWNGREELLKLSAKRAGVAVKQAPPRPTQRWQPFALAAFVLQ